ncbi:kelch domain-containing protein 10 [Strongylocentrotus purpuratus]|uniref:Kelch domain-containing protein 10 n=2 Tax=Strongylocentrotus purpuratus TaxID=7668 RepID=A0A7M7SSI0_STRPU|nr:kelch domain-containing protein 10 [Strongylocentrotus purpuratus]|eukprot:XP_790443.2 PREDICTED: kelch domain-containing protein 10 [Strongylocentrotus purpuratus]
MSHLPISVKKCNIEKPADECAEAQPYQRSGHCCATDGVNLYVFGGYHPEYVFVDDRNLEGIAEHKVFRDLWCYNFATKTWYEVKTSGVTPSETASMSMILSGNTLICFGGTLYPWGSKSNNKINTLNLTERKWKILDCNDTIPAKYGQAMTLHDGALYVYGGCRRITEVDHLFDSELHRLDMRTHEWSLILDKDRQETATMAHMRGMYRHGLAYCQDKLYVIGSSWEELTSIPLYQKVHVFDIAEGKWSWQTTIPTEDDRYPRRRAYHGCAQWKSEVYMCGGHDARYNVMDDIWCLHLPELRWEQLSTTLPVPTFFHSAAITDAKCMYLFGGVKGFAGGVHNNDRERTRIIQKIWLAIPSLSELCWQHVLDLCPDMAKLSKEDLFGLGIPRIFTERLKPVR